MITPADDVDRIMVVMDCAFDPLFGEAWNRRQVEDALVSGLCYYQILGQSGNSIQCDDAPAGFYLSRHIAGDEELLLIAVVPDHRRLGIGSALLSAFLADSRSRGAKRLFLEMRSGNPAENIYRRCGFIPIGRRLNYYQNGSGSALDAITFCCELG